MSTDQRVEDPVAARIELMVPVTLPPGVPEQIAPPVMGNNGIPMPGGKDVYLTQRQGNSLFEALRAALFNVDDEEDSLRKYFCYRKSLEEVATILRPCLRMDAPAEKLTIANKVRVMEILDAYAEGKDIFADVFAESKVEEKKE